MKPGAVLTFAANLDPTAQVVAIVGTGLMFGIVLELVRRRRLAERYALLWLLVAAALLVLAVFTGLLKTLAHLIGIEVPANFLFLAALALAFLLLLHFSVAATRLSDQTKILAMEIARIDAELREARARRGADAWSDVKPGADQAGEFSVHDEDVD